MYNIHLFLYFETDFNGNRYNIPLYYLLTYNVMLLGDVTIKSYHNFTNYFFVLYDDSRVEYIIQLNKSRNKASIRTKTSVYLKRIDNPETLFHPKIPSLSSLMNESPFTKLASTTLKSKLYDNVPSPPPMLYYPSQTINSIPRLPKLTNESETPPESTSPELIIESTLPELTNESTLPEFTAQNTPLPSMSSLSSMKLKSQLPSLSKRETSYASPESISISGIGKMSDLQELTLDSIGDSTRNILAPSDSLGPPDPPKSELFFWFFVFFVFIFLVVLVVIVIHKQYSE